MFEVMSQVYNKVAIPLIEKTNDYKKLSDTYLYVYLKCIQVILNLIII